LSGKKSFIQQLNLGGRLRACGWWAGGWGGDGGAWGRVHACALGLGGTERVRYACAPVDDDVIKVRCYAFFACTLSVLSSSFAAHIANRFENDHIRI
jgi:hypothetical protein